MGSREMCSLRGTDHAQSRPVPLGLFDYLLVASSAKFSSSTLTRGSPRMPSCRPSVCFANKVANFLGIQVAGLRHARDLVLGGRRADVRIEPAARRRHQVDRHRSCLIGIRFLHRIHAAAHRVELRWIGRSVVAAGRSGRRCRRGDVADGRLQKYFGSSNCWPINSEPTILPSRIDQAAIRLVRKHDLGDDRDHQRIGHAGHQRQADEIPKLLVAIMTTWQCLLSAKFATRPAACRSILMPMNGTIRPPRP